MTSYLAPAEAAAELGLHPARIRALIAAGELEADKINGRWLVDAASVAARARSRSGAGRPFAPHNAWAVIFLACGLEVSWTSAGVLWRLRRALRVDGLEDLAPRLRRRAALLRFRVHPGELAHMRVDRRFVLGGVSAAGPLKLGLVAGEELDAYVREGDVGGVRREHALEPAPATEANVVLRAVPRGAWYFAPGDAIAPPVAAALDLCEAFDSRAVRLGRELLARYGTDFNRQS